MAKNVSRLIINKLQTKESQMTQQINTDTLAALAGQE